MFQIRRAPTLRTALSDEDWQLLISAVGAYAHNTRYKMLLSKLQQMDLDHCSEIGEPDSKPSE